MSIKNFVFSDGCVIFIEEASVMVTQVMFNNIHRASSGNGSCICGTSSFCHFIYIDLCNFTNTGVSGSSGCGGAIYIYVKLKGETNVTNSRFVNTSANKGDGYGGGLCLYLDDHVYEYFLKNLTFIDSSAKYGSHVFISMDNITSVAGQQFGGLLGFFFFIFLSFFLSLFYYFYF
jgi:hypothetical protein